MKITLRMNNYNFDITHLVDTNNLQRTVEMKQTIDGQFHTGSIFVPSVASNELGELVDLSRAIIRNSLITIEIDERKFQWRVMADNVVDKLNGTYSHDIALIDRRSELTGFNLPDLSLTQRSFVSTEKVRATSSNSEEAKVDFKSGLIDKGGLGSRLNIPFQLYSPSFLAVQFCTKKEKKGYIMHGLDIDKNEWDYIEYWEQIIPAKVASNICVSGINNINEIHTLDFASNTATSDNTVIDINNTNIILKKKDLSYNIKGSIKVLDTTPTITLNVADGYWTYSAKGDENLIKTDGDKYVTIKAFDGAVEIYSEDFKVNKSTVHYHFGNVAAAEHWLRPTLQKTNIIFNFKYKPTNDNTNITITAQVKDIPYQTRIKKLTDDFSRWGNYKYVVDGVDYSCNIKDPLYGYDSGYFEDLGEGVFEYQNTEGNMKTCIENAINIDFNNSGTTHWTTTYYEPPIYGIKVDKYYYHQPFTQNIQSSHPLASVSLCELPTYLAIEDYSLEVETDNLPSTITKNLDEWIEHALHSMFIGETPKYTLEPSTKSALSKIISPEFTAKKYNLYQLISEVAEFLGGVNWEITKNNEIKFIFFDKLERPIADLPSEDIDMQNYEGTSDLNGYNSALQINAENVALQSLSSEGWYSVRAEDEGNTQIVNDAIMIKTRYAINSIYQVRIKGIDYDVYVHDETTEINITPRVVEYEEWKTLPSQFSTSTDTNVKYGRRYFTKSNTLYYKRGEPGIYGLGYCGGIKPGFWTTSVGNRAIFETGAVEILKENAYGSIYNTTKTDTGSAIDNTFRMYIEYYPFTSSKAMIYKDDISGFQVERMSYMNEGSQVNDPDLLGSVAKNRVNRLGGTEYTNSGYVSSMNLLPELGSANSNGQRLTQLITQTTDSYTKYFATYVADYNKISTFVGKKSDYRLYEIPNKNIVDSTRIKRMRFAVGTAEHNYENAELLDTYNNIFNNMIYTGGAITKYVAPNFARLATTILDQDGSPITNGVLLPVLTGVIGDTAFWKVRAKDNFSAGEKQVEYTLGGASIKVQQEVPYCGKYGEFVNNVCTVGFRGGEIINPTLFPDDNVGGVFSGTLLGTLPNIGYEKDAREIFSLEQQFSFHSMDIDKIKIYKGMTKYNGMFTGRDDYRVVASPCYYVPKKEDIMVDTSQIDPYYENLTSITFGTASSDISLPGTKVLTANVVFSDPNAENKGIVFYDSYTSDLIMYVKVDDTSNNPSILVPAENGSDPIFRTPSLDETINGVTYYAWNDSSVTLYTLVTEPTPNVDAYFFKNAGVMTESQDPIVEYDSAPSVSVPVYFRLLSELELVSVKFENSGDIVIPDQMFKKNIKGSTIDAFLSPFKTRKGYTYSGMYYDDIFAEQVGLNDTITTETIIFLEWTENVVNKVWGETEDTIIVEEVNAFLEIEVIEDADYIALLPDISEYELGQVIRIRPKIIDPNGTYSEELAEYMSYAPSKYYKVVAQT